MCKACCNTNEQQIPGRATNTVRVSAMPLSEHSHVQDGEQAHDHGNGHVHSHEHTHSHEQTGMMALFGPAILSFILLVTALGFDHLVHPGWFNGIVRTLWYVIAYLPVGLPVFKEAWESAISGDIFSEFSLMVIATIGAFALQEFPEGVTVMLFYTVGEVLQTISVTRARGNIKALLDQRPDTVSVFRNNTLAVIAAQDACPGDVIQVKPGEKLALDGILRSQRASFNTAALTGESKPRSMNEGEKVLAGMVNLNTVCEVKVTKAYADSKLSHILAMVQDATSRKAPTELFIRKFARVYTPIVVFLAIAITLLPALLIDDYIFRDWLYRALVFLVISCPCALVISIPLGYFGGIGAASRNGILFKGSNYLDLIARVKTVVMDKTGTLTEGVFEVQEIVWKSTVDKATILPLLDALESRSTHPVATAVRKYLNAPASNILFTEVEELNGYGMRGVVNGKELLAGNFKLLDRYNIRHEIDSFSIVTTVVAIAYDGNFMGFLSIADRIKDRSHRALTELGNMNVKTIMLSGDKAAVVSRVAGELGIAEAYGDLLPEDKVNKVREAKEKTSCVAFVGDGLNDAPVIALSDIGIAMGGLGSDAAIETADVVIQDDDPTKIGVAINIGKQTRRIVWQNILLAFGIKAIILILGAGGLASMWEAVFADVGVALLAILNAIRIQRMNFQ